MSALGRAALGYAWRGLPVLPLWWTDTAGQCACGSAPGACKPGKHPIGKLVHHGVKDATLVSRTIGKWWQRYPQANVGIACGGNVRLLVLDIDPDTGGETSLARLEQEHGALPATIEAITPRGGRHLYLLVPSGRPLPTISAGTIGDGLDHRCQGGYVAAPPSAVAGRPYTWSVDCAGSFAEAPAWLLDKLASGGAKGRAKTREEWKAFALRETMPEGARNHMIATIAGLLFRRLPEPLLAAQLVACFNKVKCDPPLEDEELERTLDSIAAREMQRRGIVQ